MMDIGHGALRGLGLQRPCRQHRGQQAYAQGIQQYNRPPFSDYIMPQSYYTC